MGWLYLLLSVVGAWFTYNAFRPAYVGPRRAVGSFFAGWLTSELALHHIAWQIAATAGFAMAGALAEPAGRLGLLISVASWIGLWRCFARGREAVAAVEAALQTALGPDYRDRIDPRAGTQLAPRMSWRDVVFPFPMRHPDVETIRNIQFSRVAGINLKLDVYRPRVRTGACPTLLQIHGGGWVIGSKNEQGIPLMLEMASRGWVCVSVDYRLSPHATFPDHLIDLKRAIQWIREQGASYGADPNFIVATGGSAGGHLCALVGLTANQPEYQPGFEDVDTSVRGCVPFYGVYDFTDRDGVYPNRGLSELLEARVMKASLAENRAAYDMASPRSRVHPAAPPFLIIHGDLDSLVPVQDARNFFMALREVSQSTVAYAEIPGAQHAFEIFPSFRSLMVIHGVQRFLGHLYSDYLAEATRPAAEVTVTKDAPEVARQEPSLVSVAV